MFREDITKLILCIVKLHLSSAMGASSKYPAVGHKMFSPLSGVMHRFIIAGNSWCDSSSTSATYRGGDPLKLLKAGFEYFSSVCCIFHSSSSFMED